MIGAPYTIPPPEMFRPEQVSVWRFTGPVLAFMAAVSILLGLGAFLP